jgi:hypothetical protein
VHERERLRRIVERDAERPPRTEHPRAQTSTRATLRGGR